MANFKTLCIKRIMTEINREQRKSEIMRKKNQRPINKFYSDDFTVFPNFNTCKKKSTKCFQKCSTSMERFQISIHLKLTFRSLWTGSVCKPSESITVTVYSDKIFRKR